MSQIIFDYIQYIIFGVIIFIISIISAIFAVKIRKINKKMNCFLNSNDEFSIEKMITNYMKKIEQVNEENIYLKEKIKILEEKIKISITKTGFVRYNPFEDTGGDLCYSLALLNENNDGFVLNSIYSREGSYNYAKKIVNGQCENYKLSEEENQALNKAISK